VDEEGVLLDDDEDRSRRRSRKANGKSKRSRLDDEDEEISSRRRKRAGPLPSTAESVKLKADLKKVMNIVINHIDM